MPDITLTQIAAANSEQPDRRSILRGAGIGALALALPACASLPGFSMTEAVRRLLLLASENAFARLIAPGGYWDERVARLGLGNLLGTRGDVLGRVLTSALFKDRLEGAFADIAIEGAERAAPLVTDAVRVIGIDNAVALVSGGPTAASSFLRGQMGSSLIEAMVPELGEAMRIAQEPLVGQLLAQLTGVDVGGVARNLSGRVDSAIWNEIGIEEAAIRRNPGATNDPLLIGVFAASGAL